MKHDMKQRYSVFLRPWGVYYYQDNTTRQQETLKTRDKDEAFRLVAAKNENEEAPAFSRHLARVYWKAGDPAGATRTWQHVMDEIPKLKHGDTRHRWLTAIKDKALDSIRNMVILETQPEHFMKVLETGGVSTNVYLRRIHNFALDMNWLPWPVLAVLTQEKLAERIDINPVYMGQIERGFRVPTVDVLLRIAKALKVRLRDIVSEL
jgi:DNA-binding XRE family transcriptional regulator